MSNFKRGDKVVFVKGECKGAMGEVNYVPQLSQLMFLIGITDIAGMVNKKTHAIVGHPKWASAGEFKKVGG